MPANMSDKSQVVYKTAYQESVKSEIEHYTSLYENEQSRKTLTETVPPSWVFVQERFNALIANANHGLSFVGEIVEHFKSHPGGCMVSIGSGPGALEMEIARHLENQNLEYKIICMDINPNVLALGRERAESEGLKMSFIEKDINELTLEENYYDLIMCHASLHHLINLEHIYYEMNRSLVSDGKVVVLDIATRNGYLMWEETYKVVQDIWKVLPEKFKYNHTSYSEKRLEATYENRDYTGDSMECIRSQDVLPLLNEYFVCQTFVPFTSISRRFLDTMYGPNYDITQELDRAVMEFIWQLDNYYISNNILKPETFFGVYTKGVVGPRPKKALDLNQRSVREYVRSQLRRVINFIKRLAKRVLKI
jgi:ubiquinone/menaquinone biosynthesis C-methylase UbiE